MASLFAITASFAAPKRQDKGTFWQDIREGMTTVWDIKPIRFLMMFATLVNLVGPGIDVALLYRLQHELMLRAQWVGIIMTCLSAGMLLGAVSNRWAASHLDMGKLLTVSAVLQVFPPICLALTRSPFVVCAVQISTGILLVAWNVQSVTLRQTLIPSHLLGRSSSVFRLSAWISIPLGDAFAGFISQAYGTRVYFMVAASVLFIVSVLSIYVKLHRTIPSTKPNTMAS